MTLRRTAVALVVAALGAGCGRISFAPADSAGLDASVPSVVDAARADAPGLDAPMDAPMDAPGMDAPGMDAPLPDVALPDAPGLDAPLPDVALPDAGGALDVGVDGGGTGCRVRWAERIAGPNTDLVAGVWVEARDRVYAQVYSSPGQTFAGAECARCVTALDRDGARLLTVPTAYVWGVGPDGAASAEGTLTGYTIREHDLDTGAELRTVGTVVQSGSSSNWTVRRRGAATVFLGSLGGAIDGVTGSPATTDDLAAVLAYYEGGARRWGYVLDGPRFQLLSDAAIFADGSVGAYVRNFGGTPVCFSSADCIPALSAAGVVLARADGAVRSMSVVPGIAPMGIVAATGDVFSVTGSALERRDAGGTVVWSRGFMASSGSTTLAYDPPRGRLVVFTAFETGSSFDGAPIGTLAADGGSLAVLELDALTGALRRSLVFGSAGLDQALGVAVDSLGGLYLATMVGGDVDLCAGGSGAGGMTDGLLVALD